LKDYESESYRLEVKMLKGIINNDFWDQNSRFYSYGMNSDRSFRKMPTVLPAVPLYFGVTDPEKSQFCLEQYAGNVFSTNWGVRILRDDSPFFKPTGYHYGSVWPLFTGWTSLAEYHYGNYQQGFMHLMNNLTIYKSWGLGFVEEVLNGARYEPSGVCPHQCWSETMVIQPAIEGLLGLQADAGENRIVLAPHLPAGWDSLSVFNIRLAEKRIDFRYRRQDGLYNYTFILKEGDGVDLIFMPAFPAGTQFTRVMLDGKEIPYTSFKTDRYVTFMAAHKLNGCSELVIETAGGISVLPVIADPRPGDVPEGIRIINSKLSGTEYRIDLEGKQGTSGTFEVYSAMPPGTARNAKFLGSAGKIFLYSVDFEKDGNKYIKKTVILPIQ
jgi:hypothetical protein